MTATLQLCLWLSVAAWDEIALMLVGLLHMLSRTQCELLLARISASIKRSSCGQEFAGKNFCEHQAQRQQATTGQNNNNNNSNNIKRKHAVQQKD